MPLTTAPDVFVSAPLARHRHRAVKEERETQMAPRNETVGTENCNRKQTQRQNGTVKGGKHCQARA